VHYLIDFDGQGTGDGTATPADNIKRLVDRLHSSWPALNTAARDVVRSDHALLQVPADDEGCGAANRSIPGNTDTDLLVECIYMITRRIRNQFICLTDTDDEDALARSNCVCLLGDKDGNYRGRACWACQGRVWCPVCDVELLPASRLNPRGMGSMVEVQTRALHEKCSRNGKELQIDVKRWMVKIGLFDASYVPE
jgi:hypothetical protein